MGRKAKNHHPKTHPNNKWGTQPVGFNNDHTNSFDPSSTRGHHPPNRRGGRNKPPSTRGRGATPYHGGQGPNNSTRGRGRGGSGRGGGRGGRGDRHNNPDITGDPNDDNFTVDDFAFDSPPPPLPFASPSTQQNGFSSHRGNRGDKHNRGNHTTTRFCTECSAVRRANLRFRDWAARALNQCSERFVAWAEDAGVGFAAADEMDWQPEPVIRVLLLGTQPEPSPPLHPSQWSEKMYQQYQQYLQQQQQQQQQNKIGGPPFPGPWSWPPWPQSQPQPQPQPWDPSIHYYNMLQGLPFANHEAMLNPKPESSNTNTNANNTADLLSVSGLGLVGDKTSTSIDQPWVPARAPLQHPATTSACSAGTGFGEVDSFGGAGVPVGVGRKRGSGEEGTGDERLSPCWRGQCRSGVVESDNP